MGVLLAYVLILCNSLSIFPDSLGAIDAPVHGTFPDSLGDIV